MLLPSNNIMQVEIFLSCLYAGGICVNNYYSVDFMLRYVFLFMTKQSGVMISWLELNYIHN